MEQISTRDGTPISFHRTNRSGRSGTGPALLFVHGVTADHRSWAVLSPPLAQHFTIYAMDRRGRGASGDAPDYDLLREVEDVAALVAAIGEPVSVFGHSYGGLIALEAARIVDRIHRLILYEPAVPDGAHLVPPETFERIQALIDGGELEAAMLTFLREVALMDGQELEIYRQSPVWQQRIPLAATIPREMLAEQKYRFQAGQFAGMQTPTLLLLGGDSPPLSRQAVETVAAALPHSQVVILPGQQHQAHRTSPDLVVRALLDFLLK